jgi:hypothetical protein
MFLIGETRAEEDGNNFVDYVSIYNQKNRPTDYKEDDNAATHYQKAIEALLRAPQEIGYDYWRIWPGDFSKQNLQATRQWVKSNSLALEYLTQASKKPYFWTENKSSNGSVLGILLPDLAGIKNLTQLTCCRAMLEAMDGSISNAAKDIETVYRVGNHFNGPQQTIEQMVGISAKVRVIETVIMILQNTHIGKKEREYLYNSLKKYIDDEEFTPDLFAMKLMCLDCLQRMYILNKDGQRVIDEKSSQIQLALFRLHCTALMFLDFDSIEQHHKPKLLKMDYEKAKELITEKFEQLEKMMASEAWQLNETMNQKHGVLQSIQESHPLLNILVIEAINLKFSAYERLRAQTLALDTIMSVLTFKENKGRLPLNLSELQEAGLLEKVPIDPFSGKPIEYKKLDDNFTVYSYGLDFDDDGGVRVGVRVVDFDIHNGDLVVWPVKKYKEIVPKQK